MTSGCLRVVGPLLSPRRCRRKWPLSKAQEIQVLHEAVLPVCEVSGTLEYRLSKRGMAVLPLDPRDFFALQLYLCISLDGLLLPLGSDAGVLGLLMLSEKEQETGKAKRDSIPPAD